MDSDSDEVLDQREHKKLVDNVLSLNTRHYISKSTRTELTSEVSEYDLVKPLKSSRDQVRLFDLTRSLKKHAGDVELRKKIKKAEVKSQTLPKPLEKPQAERIRRSTAYDQVKEKLERWEPLVTANRISTNLSFPLKDPSINEKEHVTFTSDWVVKSKLQRDIEALEPKMEVIKVDTEALLPKLTLKEMMERRREMAKMRRYQNYKEIKARQQNKIKSKSFRRIQRKEKVKEQMKEFELLQKTNPEEALKKLEEIENARADERASLRHKSTGKWAKSRQVRAKYDTESRKVLAEQLAISKELMQKQQVESSDSSSENGDDHITHDDQNGENPWFNEVKASKEVEDFVSSYRKYWEEENVKKVDEVNQGKNEESTLHKKDDVVASNSTETVNLETTEMRELEKQAPNIAKKASKQGIVTALKKSNEAVRIKRKVKHQKKLNIEIDSTAAVWEVKSLDSDNNLENNLNCDYVQTSDENNIKHDTTAKKNPLRRKRKRSDKTSNAKNTEDDNKNEKRTQIRELKQNKNYTKEVKNEIDTDKLDNRNKSNTTTNVKRKVPKIDDKKSNKKEINPVSLNSSIPDVLSYDDNEEDVDRAGIIMEAFEDVDIVDEFHQDKKDTITKSAPKDIDLTLPGWGSWGGTNLPIPKKKRRRFILKAPKQPPRKDMNRGNLIINESANDKMKNHLVSEVPFPFKSVKDFENSIRAPISNTFVPETAFRKFIKPPLTTKMGAVIEPITEDYLLHNEKKKRK